MSIVTQTIEAIRQTEKYSDKSKLLYLLVRNLSTRKNRIATADRNAFSDFIFEEVETLLCQIPEAQSYKEKDFLFEYEDHLLPEA